MLWFLMRTKEQRRERYKKLREKGLNSRQARVIRDWRPRIIKEILQGKRSFFCV